jgi:uncharacterized lipoprotein YddW (UPF0748 family)
MRNWFRLCVVLLACLLAVHVQSQTPPKREFRAAWVASVTNLDWPSSQTATPAAQQAELVTMFDGLKAAGFNAIIFQVRPECDALYISDIEPWSKYLTGSQGTAPSPLWDPLAFAITEAHKRGMELHAWFNPYRAEKSVGAYTLAASHVVKQHPDWILSFAASSGTAALKILNPGLPAVRNYVSHIVTDIVRRYDVDGIHADDYFYPYPPQQVSHEDDSTYTVYNRGIGNRDDWRRDNVNLLMKQIMDSINATKPYVRFGMSPFGIWKSGVPPGITGLDAYSVLYGDAIAWLHDGSIDYVTPQLYWKIGGSQDYGTLMPWWADSTAAHNRHYYPGHIFGSYTNAELPNQLKLARANAKVQGEVYFRAALLNSNSLGFADSLKNTYYKYPALSPVMAWKDVVSPNPPRAIRFARVAGTSTYALVWDLPIIASDGDSATQYVIYRFDHTPSLPGELADPRNIISTVRNRQFAPPTGSAGVTYSYAVTALDRNFNESEPSNVVQLNAPAVPVLSTPIAGTSALPESVQVVWRTADLASWYHLQVSTDSLFASNLLVSDSTLTDTLKWVKGCPGQVPIYWRVRARNAAGASAYSASFNFTLGIPAIAALLSPPNLTLNTPVTLTLTWGHAAAATSYHVQLATNSAFSPAVLDSAGITDTLIATPTLENYKIYFWRVRSKNAIGEAAWATYSRFRTIQATDVEEQPSLPTEFALAQNYPNPFNPSTIISCQVPVVSRVRIVVFDILGREVEELVNQQMEPGSYQFRFDASHLTSGVYFYRMNAGEFVATKRMMVVK